MNDLVPAASIRTFLLIENRLLRETLVRLFSKRGDLLVVGQSGHAEATMQKVLAVPRRTSARMRNATVDDEVLVTVTVVARSAPPGPATAEVAAVAVI